MAASAIKGAPLSEIPLHTGLVELVSMRYGPPGPEPTIGGNGWYLRRYELPGETWIEVEAYRPRDGLHAYSYIVDKPGYEMAVVLALDRGGQYLDLLSDDGDPRSAALASRCPTAATLARGGTVGTNGYQFGLAGHDRFAAAHLLTFGAGPLHGRLTPQQFEWALGGVVSLGPLTDDLLALYHITSAPTALSAPPSPAAVGSTSLSTAADVFEDVGRIASGATAVLGFLASFG